jgi:uncharacterized repeat protein (TIGR03803 family)
MSREDLMLKPSLITRGRVCVTLAMLVCAAASGTSRHPLAAQANPTTSPTAPVGRFFVLADLGERLNDPILQLQPSLIADGTDGYLYTTSTGGGTYGKGTVFKFSPTDGKPPVVLYNFDGAHGSGPQGGLSRGPGGIFYGTTSSGGKYGVGTVFSVTPSGSLTVLWDFRNGAIIPAPVNRPPTEQEKLDAAGSYPVSAPVFANGTLYGVTSYANNQQYGVVYTISGGNYTGLYQFKPADVVANGTFATSLSAGPGGSVWGTTLKGALGFGTVFQVVGRNVSIVHKFDGLSSGSMGVIQARDGLLYGTAIGPNTSFGIVYQVNPGSQAYAVIHCFDGNDGSAPVAGLTEGKDGMLYGVTRSGGKAGRGVIFRINPHPSDNHCTDPAKHPDVDADYAVVFHFDFNDGRYAVSPMIEHLTPGSMGTDFYGVTYQGGTKDAGAVYRINVRPYPKPAGDALFQYGQRMTTDTMLILTKGGSAYQNSLDQAGLKVGSGTAIQFYCARDPHIVQFVMRTGTQADGTPASGQTYTTSWGTFRYGEWHTDAIGRPNAYYDQAPGAAHRNDLTSVTTFDSPSVGGTDAATAHGWLFTAKDFAICNGKVLRTATWARGAAWDASTSQFGPVLYTNFQVSAPAATDDATAWSNTQLQWINDHLKADGYDPVP